SSWARRSASRRSSSSSLARTPASALESPRCAAEPSSSSAARRSDSRSRRPLWILLVSAAAAERARYDSNAEWARSRASVDARVRVELGRRRAASRNAAVSNAPMPSTMRPYGQCPVAKSTTAKTHAAAATASSRCGGAMPNQRGSTRCTCTGTGPPVELELLQRLERTVPLLDELEAAALELARLVEHVARRGGLSQERACDIEHREHREHPTGDEPKGHAARAPAA